MQNYFPHHWPRSARLRFKRIRPPWTILSSHTILEWVLAGTRNNAVPERIGTEGRNTFAGTSDLVEHAVGTTGRGEIA